MKTCDYAPKDYLKPALTLRRIWLQLRLVIANWDIGNSDALLYRMVHERDQMNSEISAEIQHRAGALEKARGLRGML